MQINANSIRVGNVIEYNNNLWVVLKKNHVQPGKGGAYVQIEMKDIVNGTKNNVRFISSENIEKAHLEGKKYQYQYMDRDELVVMDMESFEQLNFHQDLLGEALPFLQEGMDVVVEFCNDKPINIQLPETVILEIAEADAVVKGQTAASSNKPAILENGVRIMVPTFIEAGNRVVVRTEDGSYVERAKKD
ncbi:MAG: elongation factor P [Proteobacteria bacterium]|nr:elongation factor P [Pseudomonadota bacterium]